MASYPSKTRDRMAHAASACCLAASIAGCAALRSDESQLFGIQAPCQSASIAYRVERAGTTGTPRSPALLKFFDPGTDRRAADRRITTLAICYPHPAGRAGYARVECVVESRPQAGARRAAPEWLRRARQLADENLPGIALGDGVEEAMGLDVPVADLAPIIARLQQPPNEVAAPAASMVVRSSGTINGAPLPTGAARITELDRMVARVRRDGSLISHRAATVETADVVAPAVTAPIAMPGPAATAEPPPAAIPAPVVAASYAEPITRRLPPIDAGGP